MTFRLTPQALVDLDSIVKFLIENYPNIAPDVEERLWSLFNLLDEFPGIGRPGPRPGTSELPVRNYPYLIIFRPSKHGVEILRVFNTSRSPYTKF